MIGGGRYAAPFVILGLSFEIFPNPWGALL
jgi:hypothetical protein